MNHGVRLSIGYAPLCGKPVSGGALCDRDEDVNCPDCRAFIEAEHALGDDGARVPAEPGHEGWE